MCLAIANVYVRPKYDLKITSVKVNKSQTCSVISEPRGLYHISLDMCGSLLFYYLYYELRIA